MKTYSAAALHAELAAMAWERMKSGPPLLINPELPSDLLQAHLAEMSRIVRDHDLYALLWSRFIRKNP